SPWAPSPSTWPASPPTSRASTSPWRRRCGSDAAGGSTLKRIPRARSVRGRLWRFCAALGCWRFADMSVRRRYTRGQASHTAVHGTPACQSSTHGDECRFQLHLWRRFGVFPPPVTMCFRGQSSDWPNHREQHYSVLSHGQNATHGDEFRFRLHLWRRFRIFPPPLSTFRRRPCPSPPNHREQLSLVLPHGQIYPHGDEFRFQLHLWRRFRISPPTRGDVPPGPMPDPPVHREQLTSGLPHGQIFTHGDELRFQLHLWRRFRISPPPVAMFRRRPCPHTHQRRVPIQLGLPPARCLPHGHGV